MYKIMVSAMAYDRGRSGISVYIANVIRELAKHHDLTVLTLPEDKEEIQALAPGLHLQIVADCWKKPLLNMLWHLFILPWTMNFKSYDFIFLPAGNRRLMCRCPRFTIATVHDFSQYYIPGKYDRFRMFYIKKIIPHYLRKVDHLVTVSESTRKDTVKFCAIPETRIAVLFNGYDRNAFFFDPSFSRDRLPDKYKSQGNYILYIARIEHPGKNHLNLIKAYELLPPEIIMQFKLLLVGSPWSGAEAVINYAKTSCYADRIVFAGFATATELPDLYRGAVVYAFPSLYEGFGIPVVEAMACGTPVVCSNRSSLPEVGGDAVVMFDPEKPKSIAAALQQVLTEQELRARMRQHGLTRVNVFSWEKHAKELVDIYACRH